MGKNAYIFVRRSTAEQGDGSRIAPKVPLRVQVFYDTCIESYAFQRLHDSEMSLRKKKGKEYVDRCLEGGLKCFTPIDRYFPKVFGRILGLGKSISVYSVKVSPDTGCGDPRARNPDFFMNIVMFHELNPCTPSFERFANRCREIALDKKSPGVFPDLVVEIPDEVFR